MIVNVSRVLLSCMLIYGYTFAKIYTLDEVISESLKNSNLIKSVEFEMRKTDSYIQEVYGGALPVVNTSVNLSHSFATYNSMSMYSKASITDRLTSKEVDYASEKGSYIISGILDNVFSHFSKVKSNTSSFNLTVEQPLFVQGKISIGMKIAKIYRSTLNCKLQEEKQKVKGMVIKLFYAVLLSQKNLQLANEAVKLAEETHHLAVARFVIGKTNELDTLNSMVHLKNAQIDFRKTYSDLNLSYDSLLTNAGINEPISNFGINGSFTSTDFDLSFDTAMEVMKRDNFTLSQLKGTAEIQQQKIKLAKYAFLPTVAAGASIGKILQFDSLHEITSQKWGNDQKIFIGVSWDIFTGSVRNQRLNQSIIERDMFLTNQKQTSNNLELALRKAYEKVISNRDRLNATSEVVVLAEKGFSIAKVSYEVGSKTFLDMQNSELELNRAKTAYNAALFAFNSALIDLKILMGNL